MRPKRSPMLLLALASLLWWLAVAPVTAQQAADMPLAAIVDGAVWRYNLTGRNELVRGVKPGERYYDVVWSPNGALLAFTLEHPDAAGRTLYLASESGGPALALAYGLHPMLPVVFSPDSTEVLYGITVDGSSTSTADLVQLFRYTPQAGAAPTPVGTIDVVTACSQPSRQRLPTESRFAVEAGRLSAGHYMLGWTSFGILYSTSCNAPDLKILNLNNGQIRQLFASVEGAFVAPDGTRAVAIVGGALTFINTEAGPYTQIIPAEPPDQIGFGPDPREVFYTTRTLVGPTPLPGNAAEQLGRVYFQMPLNYRAAIRRFSMTSGRDDLIYEADAFGLGRLAVSTDGATAIFSQVPNADAWVEAVVNGAAPDDIIAMGRPLLVSVNALSISEGSVTRVGTYWDDFALNPAAEVAYVPAFVLSPVPPPATAIPVPPTATYPPTLTPPPEGFTVPTLTASGIGVGQPMRINPEVGTLNVRRRPGTGAPVVELMFGGEEVTVLAGPEDDLEGFRWWQVAVPSGAVGWVAERVNGLQTLVER